MVQRPGSLFNVYQILLETNLDFDIYAVSHDSVRQYKRKTVLLDPTYKLQHHRLFNMEDTNHSMIKLMAVDKQSFL